VDVRILGYHICYTNWLPYRFIICFEGGIRWG